MATAKPERPRWPSQAGRYAGPVPIQNVSPIAIGGRDMDRSVPSWTEPPGGLVRAMFVRDPDGHVIQFDQRIG